MKPTDDWDWIEKTLYGRFRSGGQVAVEFFFRFNAKEHWERRTMSSYRGIIREIGDHYLSYYIHDSSEKTYAEIDHDLSTATKNMYQHMKDKCDSFAKKKIRFDENIDDKLKEILEGENET